MAPVDLSGEVARKNIVLALALVGVVVLIVLGTIAVVHLPALRLSRG